MTEKQIEKLKDRIDMLEYSKKAVNERLNDLHKRIVALEYRNILKGGNRK